MPPEWFAPLRQTTPAEASALQGKTGTLVPMVGPRGFPGLRPTLGVNWGKDAAGGELRVCSQAPTAFHKPPGAGIAPLRARYVLPSSPDRRSHRAHPALQPRLHLLQRVRRGVGSRAR